MQYNFTIRKKDKGFQIIVAYKDGYKWKQKSKQGFKTKREAKEYGHVIVKELDKTALLTKDTELKELTFKEFADMFLEIKRHTLRIVLWLCITMRCVRSILFTI